MPCAIPVDVAVDVSTSYNQWTQFEPFPQFMEGVEEIRQLDDTHTHWVTSIAGVTREFDATITEPTGWPATTATSWRRWPSVLPHTDAIAPANNPAPASWRLSVLCGLSCGA